MKKLVTFVALAGLLPISLFSQSCDNDSYSRQVNPRQAKLEKQYFRGKTRYAPIQNQYNQRNNSSYNHSSYNRNVTKEYTLLFSNFEAPYYRQRVQNTLAQVGNSRNVQVLGRLQNSGRGYAVKLRVTSKRQNENTLVQTLLTGSFNKQGISVRVNDLRGNIIQIQNVSKRYNGKNSQSHNSRNYNSRKYNSRNYR